MIEFLLTGLYLSYSLSGIYNKIAKDLVWNALGVAVCLNACIYVSANVSGACLNPYFGLVQTIY